MNERPSPPGDLEAPITAARTLCEDYLRNFQSPKTHLVYRFPLVTEEEKAAYETPEAVMREQVRGEYLPYGYGAGGEDAAYHNGTLLFALCEAFDATQEPTFGRIAQDIFSGMQRMGSLSPTPGFIVRGPHPFDGKSYYRDSSLDQHTLYTAGMWRYFHSTLACEADKTFIRQSLDAVARRLEGNNWRLLVEDDSREARAGGGDWKQSDHLLLFMLAAVKDVTGSDHWRAEYERYADEEDGLRWRRIARSLPGELPRYNFYQNQWAYRMNVLARVEEDPDRSAIVWDHIRRWATDMFSANMITHWKRRDWIGSMNGDEEAAIYLDRLGLTPASHATIFDFWDRFDPADTELQFAHEDFTRDLIGPTLTVPLMCWQIALLCGDTGLINQVTDRMDQLHQRMRRDDVPVGWTWNYAANTVLLHLARQAGAHGGWGGRPKT